MAVNSQDYVEDLILQYMQIIPFYRLWAFFTYELPRTYGELSCILQKYQTDEGAISIFLLILVQSSKQSKVHGGEQVAWWIVGE